MTIRYLAVVLALVGCGGVELDERAFDIVARTDPKIMAVATGDGFTQIRQNSTAQVVITGKRLADTTSVSVGAFFVIIDSVAAAEVRATVFTDSSQPLGPVDVSLTTPTGTATKPGALRLTPFVVSPTAVTGHGTFQSPMNLCDPELEFTGGGSTVQLLAGTHHCDRQIIIGAGSVVHGDRSDPTIVTGTETGGFGMAIWFGNSASVTTIRDLTFQQPLAGASIELNEGNLVVERVVDAGGIIERGDGSAQIDRYTYDGEGTGLDLTRAAITRSTVRHCGTGDGIHVAVDRALSNGNDVTLDDVVIEDCQRGLVVGGSGSPVPMSVQVTNSRLVDNSIGLEVRDGLTSLHDVVIRGDAVTPRVSSAGIVIFRGDVTMLGGKITDHDIAGIQVFTHANGLSNSNTTLNVADVLIARGQCGIDFGGLDNQLFLRGSTIRGQTQAAVRISALDSFINLGEPASPGANTLSVASGFAIDDTRHGTSFFDRYILAAGTTLNGASFDGQTIDGPAELAPYYRIVDFDSGLQF